MNIPDQPIAMSQSPKCDSYEARLTELLDTFTQTGSNESIAAIHRALEQGTGR